MTAATAVLGEAGADVGARPTALLPIPQLVRISLYWLGLTAIDAAVGLFITNRLEFDGFVPQANVGTTMFLVGIGGCDRRDHHPADGRLHQRLHRQPLGPAQAVHRVRLAARRRVPGRHRQRQHRPGPRGVHDPAQLQHQHRPRPVPGLRAGPRRGAAGRPRERPRRDDADRRQRHRLRARLARRELRRHVARPVRGRDRRAGDDAERHAAGGPGAARRGRGRAGRGRGSPARPGRPTSSRSAPSCGCSCRGCCS